MFHAAQRRHFSFWSEFKEKVQQGVRENKDLTESFEKLKEMGKKVESSTSKAAQEVMDKSQSWSDDAKKKAEQTSEQLQGGERLSIVKEAAARVAAVAQDKFSQAQEKVYKVQDTMGISMRSGMQKTAETAKQLEEEMRRIVAQKKTEEVKKQNQAEKKESNQQMDRQSATASAAQGSQAKSASAAQEEDKQATKQQQPHEKLQEEKAKEEAKATFRAVLRSIAEKVGEEYGHVKEHVGQYYYSGQSRSQRKKHSIEEFEAARTQADGTGALTSAAKEAAAKRRAEAQAAKEANLKLQEEAEEYTGGSALVSVVAPETMWDKRINRLGEKFRSLRPLREWRTIKRKVSQSDNIVTKKAREAKEMVEDFKDIYETSQHPLVWKARDLQDTVMGESEMGWALGELIRQDEHFSIAEFQEEMEEYMIPLVTEAYLKGDELLLYSVCEKAAQHTVHASCKGRQTSGDIWDPRIFDIDQVQVEAATVEGDIPIISISYMVQQVNCVKNKEGKVISGHETNIKSVYYKWDVRRDFENPDFDWKLCKFETQEVFSLSI
eukprot:gb/GEZN01004244.1/.p1 GENE.gb/GEZN01004244.1/~~gb/GEZN01004244.1/.p1  ORF type:complete len:604 (+),score=149.72 gb/GEZN01004244.1/:162-1814(+)